MSTSKRPKTTVAPMRKKIAKIHTKKLYKIVWRDAFSEVDEWHYEGELDSQDYLCETIGFLIEDNGRPNYYTLASTVTHDGHFCSVMNIPKSMVISKKQINL